MNIHCHCRDYRQIIYRSIIVWIFLVLIVNGRVGVCVFELVLVCIVIGIADVDFYTALGKRIKVRLLILVFVRNYDVSKCFARYLSDIFIRIKNL